MKNELMTFLVLLMFAATVGLSAMLIQTKREALQKAPATETKAPAAAAATVTSKVAAPRQYASTIALPKPKTTGSVPLETAIATRRTRRAFSEQKITMTELGQMLWSAQGVTDAKTGKRTSPSAREVYFFTVYAVVRNVDGLEPGLYEYLPDKHALGKTPVATAGELLTVAGVQDAAQKAPVVLLLAAEHGKGYEMMKERAPISAALEAGHIGQNLYLQAESLKLGLVVMGGFDSAKVVDALKLDPAFTVVYVVPFGHRGVEAPAAE